MQHVIEGGCHCGNLSFNFKTTAGLDSLELRACQCSFCRVHGARTTSDPKGEVQLRIHDGSKLIRYRFGLKITDFLLCGNCGVFIGAVMDRDGSSLMTLNANAFKPPPPLSHPLAPMDFGSEDVAARITRREAKWTPVAA